MSKAKKIIIIVAICDVVIWCIIGIALYRNINSSLELKSGKAEVEYGEEIPVDPAFYLKKSVDRNIIKQTKVTYKRDREMGKEYDKVGRYTVKLSYKDESAKVRVTVKDTTKPKFNNINSFETFVGVDINWEKYIKAEDLSETDLRISDSNVNISKVGEYIIKAEADDICGNSSEKEIKVIVKDRPANMIDYRVNIDKNTGKVIVSAVNGEADSINRSGASPGSVPSYSGGSNISHSSGSQEAPAEPSGGDGQTGGDGSEAGGSAEPSEPSGGDDQTGNDSPLEENIGSNEETI